MLSIISTTTMKATLSGLVTAALLTTLATSPSLAAAKMRAPTAPNHQAETTAHDRDAPIRLAERRGRRGGKSRHSRNRNNHNIVPWIALGIAAPFIIHELTKPRVDRHRDYRRDSKPHRSRRYDRFDNSYRYDRRNRYDRFDNSYRVPSRKIRKRLRRQGMVNISPIRDRGETLRVRATGPQGDRLVFVFDAYTGDLIRSRTVR